MGTLVLASAFKTLEEVVGNWTDVTSEVVNGVKLPDKLSPFINKTAVAEFKKKNSSYTVSTVGIFRLRYHRTESLLFSIDLQH